MMRRRRPLMRGAMVAGAGYAAGRSVAKSQAQSADQNARIAELEAQQAGGYAAPPQQQYAPAPPPPQYAPVEAPPQESAVDQLTKLKALIDAGLLTTEEYEVQKARILNNA